jgi:integrase
LPRKKLTTQAVEGPRLKFWSEYLGDKRLSDINSDILLKARSYIEKNPIDRKGWRKKTQKRGAATANRYMALLRHVFSVAERDWEWIDRNPVSRVRPLKEPHGRERFLTDDELKTIIQALGAHPRKDFVIIVQIALITGCRRHNAEAIRWEHIDFDRPTITFPDTKNNRPHVAPITVDLAEELKNTG